MGQKSGNGRGAHWSIYGIVLFVRKEYHNVPNELTHKPGMVSTLHLRRHYSDRCLVSIKAEKIVKSTTEATGFEPGTNSKELVPCQSRASAFIRRFTVVGGRLMLRPRHHANNCEEKALSKHLRSRERKEEKARRQARIRCQVGASSSFKRFRKIKK